MHRHILLITGIVIGPVVQGQTDSGMAATSRPGTITFTNGSTQRFATLTGVYVDQFTPYTQLFQGRFVCRVVDSTGVSNPSTPKYAFATLDKTAKIVLFPSAFNTAGRKVDVTSTEGTIETLQCDRWTVDLSLPDSLLTLRYDSFAEINFDAKPPTVSLSENLRMSGTKGAPLLR